jgi:predicted nucleic acid-binding protein
VSTLVLDTDVASLSIKRRLSPATQARLAASLVCVTFVTVGELTRWVRLHEWGPVRRAGMSAWLDGVVKLPHDETTAYVWGELSAAATRRGRNRPQNDTWIAACCLSRGLPLATRNVKDFTDFAEYHGLELITD